MHYSIVVFGVKDASENVIRYIHTELQKVDLIVTIAPEDTQKIPVYEARRYPLDDD